MALETVAYLGGTQRRCRSSLRTSVKDRRWQGVGSTLARPTRDEERPESVVFAHLGAITPLTALNEIILLSRAHSKATAHAEIVRETLPV